MMDEGRTSPGDFVLVNIEVSQSDELIGGEIPTTEYIWGTTKFISIQPEIVTFTPSEDVLFVLQSLPKDTSVIFYDGGGKDALAGAMAQILIDLKDGHELKKTRILWMGLDRWKKLGYPYYPDSNPPGGF
jgi:rhodanese-related sulfurtransferase